MLGTAVWFNNWEASDLDSLFSQSQLREYAKSEMVYQDYQREELLFLVTGSVWCSMQNESGTARFGMIYPCHLIGLGQLMRPTLDDAPCYVFHAAEPTMALAIPTVAIQAILNGKPLLWRSLAQASILYQRHCIKLALLLYGGSTKERLISALYQFGVSRRHPMTGTLPLEISLSQEELAVLIQSSRPHVNRALRELEDERLISLKYKRIEIQDPMQLQTLALMRQSPSLQSL